MSAVPHPIPYQGSKRRLAPRILAHLGRGRRLFEPFAGSAAITLGAAAEGRFEAHVLGDSLAPLVEIWGAILDQPERLAAGYEDLWREGEQAPRETYLRVREAFNREHEPAQLLYLLARCVKNAVRFNADGDFNQSADHRRLGMRPERMRQQIEGASALLRGRTQLEAGDFRATIARATAGDVVYLDPPYQGTSGRRDPRYFQQLGREELSEALDRLRRRQVPVAISYDGRLGDRRYGEELPAELGLVRLELPAGRSSQATLAGRNAMTFESLYLSPELT